MREYLTVDRDANAIRLRREAFSGTFLLVEGSSDKSFYERFTDRVTCVLVVISGKPSNKDRVIEVLNVLQKSDFHGVLAIVDADFDCLEGFVNNNTNLFRTDLHDLETMLISSPALDKVITEFGSEEKITKFGQDIRTVILENGLIIGYLRWISKIDGLNLTFEGIKFSSFINEKTLKIDESKLIQEVKNQSQAHSLNNKDIQQRINSKKNNNHDPCQVCCGHDLVEILSFGLRKAIGSYQPSEVKPDVLERSLRLAYEEVYFYETNLCLAIRSWESNNQQFKVWK
ncbi:DUF4435 domain-containing protein [Pseudanabaena galeata UHCC 0370]|uniref:DUF4435 domain-containing protein n=1 Tax=Pseudanabaena galeata UHCC 0370 TaxID=3110310 RepID=A0ABU5TMA0_9CYAN|nr:DUF4435 domain-containing protein [Pseudanabaena galeata]MEA5479416.1 DUF4435 domain-containing protein [Pseudanabaena galeata UHCC 0370]